MELIDRYVYAIGRHLPRKTRADIETEIRSTLEDMLADRSAETGLPVDEAMVKEMLKEYGPPVEVAARYLPERYLIGPRMFPIFWLVVRVVFAVLTALAIVGLGVRIGANPGSIDAIAAIVSKALVEYISGMVIALGNIVLVLAILERVLPESQVRHLNPSVEQDWDPGELVQEPIGDEVKLWEPVVSILFTLAALVIFNFYPQIIGVAFNPNSMTMVPFLSAAFFSYLPWLNLLWVLEIGLQVALLRLGHYTPLIRWYFIALKAGGVVLIGAMLSGPSLVGMTVNQLTAAGIDPNGARALVEIFRLGVQIGLLVAIIATTVEIIREVYRLLVKPTHLHPMMFEK